MTTEQDTVRAFRWDCDLDFSRAPAWLREAHLKRQVRFGTSNAPNVDMLIPHPGDIGVAKAGDYVLIDAAGQLSAMSPREFEAAFEAAGEEPEPVQDVTEVLRQLVQARDAKALTVVTLEMVTERLRSQRQVVSKVYRPRAAELA